MTVQGILILLILTVGIPMVMGFLPVTCMGEKKYHPGFLWISGCMMMWALFQVVCVYNTLLHRENGYVRILSQFKMGMAGLTVLGILSFLALGKPWKKREEKTVKEKMSKNGKIFLAIFLALVLFQLFMAVFFTYGDGDDAYYVATSTLTHKSQTLYELMPYSTGNTQMDMRHSLAPFPVWIAVLASYSNIEPVVISHTILPGILIALTYVIFERIGQGLFEKEKEKKYLFLSFVALITIFGDTSSYTVENFMLARMRQGKAAFGSIIIPTMIYLMILIFKSLQQNKKIPWGIWGTMLCGVTAACLCTTLGTFLVCMLLGILSFLAAVFYRKISVLVLTGLCMIPAIVFAVLYIKI